MVKVLIDSKLLVKEDRHSYCEEVARVCVKHNVVLPSNIHTLLKYGSSIDASILLNNYLFKNLDFAQYSRLITEISKITTITPVYDKNESVKILKRLGEGSIISFGGSTVETCYDMQEYLSGNNMASEDCWVITSDYTVALAAMEVGCKLVVIGKENKLAFMADLVTDDISDLKVNSKGTKLKIRKSVLNKDANENSAK